VSTWVRDEGIVAYVEERLRQYKYVAIGEFHLFGADADLPVPRRIVQLAKQHGLMLHAHSDADAVERLFQQYPDARILWAHSGFERPERVREMLRKHRNLWADLAFRSDHAAGGRLAPEWREAFLEFPERFMVGTDTFVPERWHYIPEHAAWSRGWLADLPSDVAERIAWKNGEALVAAILASRR
jgi:predicted TIM-barrel fold metal-dependent hydrolase